MDLGTTHPMRRRCTRFSTVVLSLSLLLAAGRAAATVILDNLPANQLDAGTVIVGRPTSSYAFATSFVIGAQSYQLDRIELRLANYFLPYPGSVNDVIVSVHASDPTTFTPGDVIEEFHIVDGLGTRGQQPVETLVAIDSVAHPTLDHGLYWIAVSVPEGVSASAIWYGASVASTVAEQNDWGDWRRYTGGAGAMRITGTAVPEPVVASMLGLGLAGLGAARRRAAGSA